MSGTGSAMPSNAPQSLDPIWVFESQLNVDIERGPAAIARKCRGAIAGEFDGPTGSNYALPTRTPEGKLLEPDELRRHVGTFRAFAEQHPEQQFRLLPSYARKTPAEHERFADLMVNLPSNCILTGRMLELLGRLEEVRIIILDANVRFIEKERKHVLDQYFTANEGLWNVTSIEILSIGSPQTMVANDHYAKGRGYRHRIIGAETERYGDYAPMVRELLSVAHATKLVSMNDPTGTSTGNVIGALQLAAAGGLEIDEVLIQ